MCDFITAGLGALFSGAGASAAGASAGLFGTGVTLGQALTAAGTVASVGGALQQGQASAAAYGAQADLLRMQAREERQRTGVEDQRTRDAFRTEIRRQAAELAARGIDLSSPTAIALGESAAREMSFESAAVRTGGRARVAELTATQRSLRAQGASSLLRGRVSAATSALTGAADIWPELLQ